MAGLLSIWNKDLRGFLVWSNKLPLGYIASNMKHNTVQVHVFFALLRLPEQYIVDLCELSTHMLENSSNALRQFYGMGWMCTQNSIMSLCSNNMGRMCALHAVVLICIIVTELRGEANFSQLTPVESPHVNLRGHHLTFKNYRGILDITTLYGIEQVKVSISRQRSM